MAISDEKDPSISIDFLLKYFSKFMSETSIKGLQTHDALYNTLRYDPHKAMEDQSIDKIFMGEILSVAGSQRGMKLGTIMTMQSMELAREKECDGYFALLSGIFGQKIYKDLYFSWMKELVYANFRDEDGNLILDDTREHKSAITALKRL